MKLHYVYYAIQKDGTPKYGATENPSNRCANYLQWNLVSAYTCPIKAGDKEIELQQKQFGKRDSSQHYAIWKKMIKTPKFIQGSKKGGVIARKKLNALGKNRCVGEENGMAKISNKDKDWIIKVYHKQINQYQSVPKGKYSTKQLADKFNVTPSAIGYIVKHSKHKT